VLPSNLRHALGFLIDGSRMPVAFEQ
jgi:hypothetical protein